MDVLHDGDRAIEALELWKQTYPRDFVPRTNLSARYAAIGRYPEALEAARDGVRLNPDAGVAYAALAHSSICLGQHQEARAALDQAMARKLDPPYSRYMLYGIAILQGDTTAMQQQVDGAAGTPAEAGMLAMQSVASASTGRVRDARHHTLRAIELARGRGFIRRCRGLFRRRRVVGSGVWQLPRGQTGGGTDARPLSGPVRPELERAGACGLRRFNQGQKARRRDGSSISRGLVLQGLVAADGARGAVAPQRRRSRGRGAAAGWQPHRARNQRRALAGVSSRPGLLEAGRGRTSETRVPEDPGQQGRPRSQGLQSRGPDALSPGPPRPGPGSRARSDVGASRSSYEALLAFWRDADPDLAIVRAARREYRQLGATLVSAVR